MRLEVEGEEVGGQILPHFYCEDMMNVMNKVIVLRKVLVMSMVVVQTPHLSDDKMNVMKKAIAFVVLLFKYYFYCKEIMTILKDDQHSD